MHKRESIISINMILALVLILWGIVLTFAQAGHAG